MKPNTRMHGGAKGPNMEIDEGMIVTVEELGMKFVVVGISGDCMVGFDGLRVYSRIDYMKLVPLRMRDDRETV